MKPKVIIHNSISLDGSLVNFDVNMPLHYKIAGGFQADILLVGSKTARIGMDMFFEKIPEENKKDFQKPDKDGILWAIPDSGGRMRGFLHVLRQSEYCRDVVVFVSETSPEDYIRYLKQRDYDHHVVGKNKCDLRKVLNILNEKYHAKTVSTDTGSELINILIEQKLVSEISLLVHPTIVGKHSYNIFGSLDHNLKLKLIKKELLESEYVWLLYEMDDNSN